VLRAKYGDAVMMRKIVETVVAALESVGEMGEETNFAEFKYKEQLHKQLVTTFYHLERLMTDRDRELLTPALSTAHKIISANPPESEA